MLQNTQQELLQKIKELQYENNLLRQEKKGHNSGDKLLKEILNNIPAPIYLKDAQGRYLLINKKYEELAHVTLEEIVGKNDFDIFPHPVAALFRAQDEEVIQKDAPVEFEETIPLSDGIHTFITSKFALHGKDGAISAVGGFCTDITERKQGERDLRKSEERYRLLYTNTPAMLHSIDQNGQLLVVSDTWLEKLGYCKEEVIGRQSTDFLTEESRRYASEEVLPYFFQKGYCNDINYTFVKKNGEEMKVLLSATAEKDEEGNIIRSLTVLQDITEKQRLESQLRQAHKMEAIGTMAGGIAHDFNNILAIIMANADMALDGIPDGNPSRHNINQILVASNRAKNLVKQILAFTRQTKKKATPINIIQTIEDSLTLLRSTIPTSVEMRQKFELDDGFIMADPTQIHQLILNLCTNATQAMNDKGVLEVSLTKVNLTNKDLVNQSGKEPGSYIRLSVNDTGEGMEQAIINRIFDPFFTTREVGKGTGMGLSVVHGIIESHNGMITVESKVGKGSTFHVFFPATEETTRGKEETADALPTGEERIIFVDDEMALAEMGGKLLEHLGYTVTALTSSTEALEMFRSQPDGFDLIITDMSMPELTGKDFAVELLKIRPDIPIILCTGYSSHISKENAEEIGIREFFMKPFDRKQLAKTIRKVLDENAT